MAENFRAIGQHGTLTVHLYNYFGIRSGLGELTGVVAIAYTVVALQLPNLNSDQSRVLRTKCDLHMQAILPWQRSLSGLEVLAPRLHGRLHPHVLSNHALLVFHHPPTCHSCMTSHVHPTNQNQIKLITCMQVGAYRRSAPLLPPDNSFASSTSRCSSAFLSYISARALILVTKKA